MRIAEATDAVKKHRPSGSAVIAIDGGGSKTDIVALTLEGELVFRARRSGSNPQVVGIERSLSIIRSLANEAAGALGDRALLQTSVYLAGMDLPVEIEEYSSAIKGEPWAVGAKGSRATVDNDLFALLRAGTSRSEAVAVVCGTGINAVGVRADGHTARFPALGMISGDWGGGRNLGARALWHAARSEDGRGTKTLLQELVPKAFNLPTVMDVIEAIHLKRIAERSVSILAPVLFNACAAGDEVAASVVDRQADEITILATTALQRLGLLQTDVPVILGGSVLASNDSRLLSRIRLGLQEKAPRAHIHLVTAPPILGAGLLALEAAGADAEALSRARKELEHHPVKMKVLEKQ